MLNTVHFDPWQRSLFVPSVSSANTNEKGPLLAGNSSLYLACVNIAVSRQYLARLAFVQVEIFISLRGRRSSEKRQREREARSWGWVIGGNWELGGDPSQSHDRASRSNSPSPFPFERRPRRLLNSLSLE